jgi:hypothetical protein
MIYDEDPFRRRPRKSIAKAKTIGEICLDGGKSGQMAFQRPPNHQIEAVISPKRKVSSSRSGFCIPLDAI